VIIPTSLARRCLGVAIALSLTTTARADDVATRFERIVAEGLPTTFAIHHRAVDGDEGTSSLMTIDERLPVELAFPDGTTGSMYAGTLDGHDIVATRHDGHVELDDERHLTRRVTDMTPTPHATRNRRAQALAQDGSPRTVNVHFLLHENLRERFTADDIHHDYVAWWLKDMTKTILPFMRIVVHYHMSDMPEAEGSPSHMMPGGIMRLDLRNANALQVVADAAEVMFARVDGTADAHLNKLVMLVGGELKGNIDGMAYQRGAAAIASVDGSYRVVAHELGHLFGAEHDDGAVLYRGGWWCESNMYPVVFQLRSKCYAYTRENQRRIRNYAIAGPESVFAGATPIED
jgi:hypothetical protein